VRGAHLLGVTHHLCNRRDEQWWITPSANPPYNSLLIV
jgi:hypothetical protein